MSVKRRFNSEDFKIDNVDDTIIDMNDMKIAVYGDVANVTLHTDFHLEFGEDSVVINDQMTLLFLKTDQGWRIVHEHHSPLNKTEE